MKINFDKKADAVYLEFDDSSFFKNKKIDDETIFDFNEENQIIGIEILNASKRIAPKFLQKISA